MKTELEKLIDLARKVESSPKDREEQRRSFAFGNAGFENDRITRTMVNEVAEQTPKKDG